MWLSSYIGDRVLRGESMRAIRDCNSKAEMVEFDVNAVTHGATFELERSKVRV